MRLLQSRKHRNQAGGAHAPSAAAPAMARVQRASRPGAPDAQMLRHAAPAVRLVQTKVAIGRVGDAYESEADQAAERVASGRPVPQVQRMPTGALGRLAQREAEAEGEEEAEQSAPVQRQTEEEEEKPVQAAAVQRQTEEEEAPVQAATVQRPAEEEEQEPVQALATEPADRDAGMHVAAGQAIAGRGPGSPLLPGTRRRLERGFGVDLGEVRVHEGSAAQHSAAALKARSFTHGSHIWLGRGESQRNIRLMAHETTHVLQQGGVVRRLPVEPQAQGEEERDRPEGEAAPAGAAMPSPTEAPAPLPGSTPVTAATPSAVQPTAPAPAPQPLRTPGVARTAAPVGEGAATAASGPGPAGEASPIATGRTGEQAPQAAEGPAEQTAPAGAGVEASQRPPGGEPAEPATPTGEPPSTGPTEQEPAAAGAPGGTAEPVAPGGEPAAAMAAQAAIEAEDQQRLQRVLGKVGRAARAQQGPAAHRGTARATARAHSAKASAAAPSPANEAGALGEARQVESMAGQPPGKVDQPSFLELVKQKLRQMDMPANPSEMGKFKSRGGAGGLKGSLQQGVTRQTEAAAGAIQGAATATPTAAEPRQAENLPPPAEAPAAADVGAAAAVPQPRSDEQVSLQRDRQDLDQAYEHEKLTPERLEKANDPRFSAAAEAREEVHTHAERAPQQYRAEEADYLGAQRPAAEADAARGGRTMRAARVRSETGVHGRQNAQMSAETRARQKIAEGLNKIYERTRQAVEDRLQKLDAEVDALFDSAEQSARRRFEDFVEDEFDAWKDRRYSVLSGKWTWVKDRFRDINELPDVKNIFTHGQDLYFQILDRGIDRIGRHVDTTLAWCTRRTEQGREEVKTYLGNLDDDLKALGAQAAEDVLGKFDELKDQVASQRDALADKLVQRYRESRDKLNARIEEIKNANRSLIVRAKRAIQAVLAALDNFRKKIMALISEAGDVIERILDDPIQFLKNLLSAVKKGFGRFADSIWTHLKAGLVGWLFGTLASAGVRIPTELSVKAVVGFLMEVLGLTWDRLRPKLVRLIGARNVALVEKVVGYVALLFREGPAGLWEHIKESLDNLKEVVIDAIKDWIVTKIVTAAVTKLVSMFNPVGAIVQAVLTIYNVIMFFVERIDQILQLVRSIIQSLGKIVSGQIDAAAAFVERTLGLMVPLMIAFLARLLGIGGIAEKVRRIVQKVRRRISRAIDKALKKIVAKFKKLFGRGKGGKAEPAAKANTQIAVNAVRRLRKPARASSPAEIVKEKHRQARGLEKSAKRRLPRGMKLQITIDSLGEAEKDQKIDFTARVTPNDASQRGALPLAAGADKIPASVDILGGGKTLISSYKYASLSGSLKPALYSGTAISLEKIAYKPKGAKRKKSIPATASQSVTYTIAAAHELGYGSPPAAFKLTDKNDDDEVEGYRLLREGFPVVMQAWWRSNGRSIKKFEALNDAGLVEIGDTGLLTGASKWHFIHGELKNRRASLKPAAAAALDALAGKPIRKDEVEPIFNALDAAQREEIGRNWMDRWGSSTHIHHIKPLNFGGSNRTFVPLSAARHVGGDGVHPKFWQPLKKFLIAVKERIEQAKKAGQQSA
jgi:hypothetical protein